MAGSTAISAGLSPWRMPCILPCPAVPCLAGEFAEAIRDQFLQERVEFFK